MRSICRAGKMWGEGAVGAQRPRRTEPRRAEGPEHIQTCLCSGSVYHQNKFSIGLDRIAHNSVINAISAKRHGNAGAPGGTAGFSGAALAAGISGFSGSPASPAISRPGAANPGVFMPPGGGFPDGALLTGRLFPGIRKNTGPGLTRIQRPS
jgi:hypothetical protein